MAKRANGEGTITLRKDGRWEAASYVPTLDGRMKRVRFYARSRKEAHEKLVAKHEEVRRGLLTPNSQVTVAEYLQQWLESVVPRRNRRNTARGYEGVVRLYIVPRIGSKRLTLLTVRDVQNAAYSLLDDGHSIRTAQKFRTVLSAALTRAMRDELVSRNVARLIELPMAKRKEFLPWNPDEVATFLRTAHGHPWYIGYLIALTYGLRAGEIAGLRWADVDFATNQITVRQQISRIDGSLQAASVKTDAGNRRLPLVPFIRHALLEHATATSAVINEHLSPIPSETFTTEGTVLTSKVGTPVEPRGLLRTFDILTARAGLRRITLHQARHTVATLLGSLQIDPKDVQMILGHSNVSTTMQIYQHGNHERRRDAIMAVTNTLEAHLGQPSPDVSASASESVENSYGSRQGDDVAVNAFPLSAAVLQGSQRDTEHENPNDPSALLIFRPAVRIRSGAPHSTPVISVFADLPHDQIVLLEVRARNQLFGAVAVNGCRQIVTSTVASAPRLQAALSDLIALREVLGNAHTAQQTRAAFPLSLIPTDRLDPMEEAA